jgi:DNA-binding transcriptional MerR regulator
MEPFDPKKLTKLYYTIGEVADMFEVNTSLIRFWEKEFNMIQPRKNSKGNRMFTPKDIETFYKIHSLVKLQGYTLDGAKKVLKAKKISQNSEQTTHPNDELILRLEAIKEKLHHLKRD